MPIEINTKVSVADNYGRGLGNITLLDAKFFGRPNFSGEMDRFKDSRRKFTVLIPNEVADQLRALGWNVKTTLPTPEEIEQGRGEVSHLKVMVDDSSNIWIRHSPDDQQKLESRHFGVIDRSFINEMDMELRAWMYNADEVRDGLEEPKYSARLVQLVANLRPNLLAEKYGNLV